MTEFTAQQIAIKLLEAGKVSEPDYPNALYVDLDFLRHKLGRTADLAPKGAHFLGDKNPPPQYADQMLFRLDVVEQAVGMGLMEAKSQAEGRPGRRKEG